MINLVRLATSPALFVLLFAALPAAAVWLLPPLSDRLFALIVSVSIAGVGLILAFNLRRVFIAVVREQRNLAQVAGGLADVRGGLDEQRNNLGGLASGVAEVRDTIAGEQRNLGDLANGLVDFRVEIAGALDHLHEVIGGEQNNLGAVAYALGEVRDQIVAVDERLAEQQTNLGMVAAGVDDVRRSRPGAELSGERYAALSEALIAIADRMDRLDASDDEAGRAVRVALDPDEA